MEDFIRNMTMDDFIAELRRSEGLIKEGGTIENTLHLADRLENIWRHEMEASKLRDQRNCDLYESEDEAKEAYEKLFYGDFQLKGGTEVVRLRKKRSPEFSAWLMAPVKKDEKEVLDRAREEKERSYKTVEDVINAMTGVGTGKGFYYNSEVREFGRILRKFLNLDRQH